MVNYDYDNGNDDRFLVIRYPTKRHSILRLSLITDINETIESQCNVVRIYYKGSTNNYIYRGTMEEFLKNSKIVNVEDLIGKEFEVEK